MPLAGSIGLHRRMASLPLRRTVMNGSRPHLTRSYHITTRPRPIPPIQSSSLLSRPGRKQPSTNPIQHPSSLGSAKRTYVISFDVQGAVEVTKQIYSAIHSTTGLPWYLTIPLIALGLNLSTRWPITVYLQDMNRRRLELTNVIRAWNDRNATLIRKKYPELTPAQKDKAVGKLNKEVTKRIYHNYHVERWKDYLPLFVVFPVWIFNIEALRRLCGAKKGLLGMMMYGDSDATSKTAEPLDTALVSRLIDIPAVTTTTTTPEVISSVSSTADPSLATGGCLWFPDLMAADPYYILPGMLSILLVLNTLPTTREGLRALIGVNPSSSSSPQFTTSAKGRLALHRSLLLLSVCAGPLTAQFPAAIHLYWVSSAAITLGMKRLADRLWPLPKMPKIEVCKGRLSFDLMPKREKKKTPTTTGQ